jgi:hypothetical protein
VKWARFWGASAHIDMHTYVLTSQQMALASVNFTPLIFVVTAFNVEGEPWAQTIRSLPVYALPISHYYTFLSLSLSLSFSLSLSLSPHSSPFLFPFY